jgi:hypothetical protein
MLVASAVIVMFVDAMKTSLFTGLIMLTAGTASFVTISVKLVAL